MFLGSCAGVFLSVDPRSGRPLWDYDISNDGDARSFHGDMVFTDSLVIIGTDPRRSHVYAFEKQTGSVRWMVPLAEGLGTDIVRQGARAYGVTLDDELLCIDIDTGEVVWRFRSEPLPEEGHFSLGSSPAVDDGVVYFGARSGFVFAFDAATGKEIWRRDLGSECVTSLVKIDTGLLVGTRDAVVHRLDPRDGSSLATLGFMSHLRGALVPAGDVVLAYFADEGWYGDLVALEPSLEGVRWSLEPPSGTTWPTSRPFVYESWVLAGTGDGEIRAIDLRNGQEAWSHPVDPTHDWSEDGTRVFGRHESSLFVGTFSGVLYAFDVRFPE